MKKLICAILLSLSSIIVLSSISNAQTKVESSEIIAARNARDSADYQELQKLVTNQKKEAVEKNSFEAYLQLALFSTWLCEAIESSQKKELFKPAAEAGVAAAEKAVELNPNSSEAHQLLGDLLNQLIPHVFGGGMRYGTRATDELDKALELNPKNVDAYVSRAIVYYYTPDSFGGSKPKAFEMLKKAVEIDAKADFPRIWLAFFYLDAKQNQEAFKHISVAREINPRRAFTNFVYAEVTKSLKKPKSAKKTTKKGG